MEARSTTSILLERSPATTAEAELAATSAVDSLGLLMEGRELRSAALSNYARLETAEQWAAALTLN